MTRPAVWGRRAPIELSAVLAAGAVLHPLAIGDMIRCGPSATTPAPKASTVTR
jgi:hypothetical protein